jgi:hypothetical protein
MTRSIIGHSIAENQVNKADKIWRERPAFIVQDVVFEPTEPSCRSKLMTTRESNSPRGKRNVDP